MMIPGRKFSAESGYRYGFNGKEKDNSTGEGNLDFGARIMDVRLGRFLSKDPMSAINPGESLYTFAGNNPIALTDFDGLFKISPYFAKKYPTLAKIIEHVLPLYINNTTARDNWIDNMGFADKKAGISAWEEMLTYGKGPWITPQLDDNEIKTKHPLARRSITASRFGFSSISEWANDQYSDNITYTYKTTQGLEAAIKSNNADDIAFYTFKTMILIFHESGHWARRMKADKQNRTLAKNEDGALAEEAVFGMRFSYTGKWNGKDEISYYNQDAVRDDLIRQGSKVANSIFTFFTGKNIGGHLKNLKPSGGQAGDPVLKDAEIKEGKVFKSNSSNSTGATSYKGNDFAY